MATHTREKPIQAPARSDLHSVVQSLLKQVEQSKTIRPIGHYVLPQPEATSEIIMLLREVLFFGYIGKHDLSVDTQEAQMTDHARRLHDLLAEQIARSFRHDCQQQHRPCDHCHNHGEAEAMRLMNKLPDIREQLEEDVKAAYDGDPAAKSFDEVVFSYPGLYAITVHRVAHELVRQEIPLLPRLLSELAHSATGIDIHPGAQIGRAFFIDHGTGVVIGETAVLGDHVKMYQGVTLGALSFPRDACGALIRGAKRHPTIEDHVTIYAGAVILGGDTVIGKGSVIGGSVWLTRSVPPGTKVIIEAPRLRYQNSRVTVRDGFTPDFQI